MHPCPENWLAIRRAVLYYARAAQAFSAGIECRHCIVNHYNVITLKRIVSKKHFFQIKVLWDSWGSCFNSFYIRAKSHMNNMWYGLLISQGLLSVSYLYAICNIIDENEFFKFTLMISKLYCNISFFEYSKMWVNLNIILTYLNCVNCFR